jgi:hypothetical protein
MFDSIFFKTKQTKPQTASQTQQNKTKQHNTPAKQTLDVMAGGWFISWLCCCQSSIVQADA